MPKLQNDEIGSIIGSDNIFADIGFSPADAVALKLKARLHAEIIRKVKGISQSELQSILNEPQPRISDLLRGKISKFSIETLIGYAVRLNLQPEIRTRETANPSKLLPLAKITHSQQAIKAVQYRAAAKRSELRNKK